MGRRSACFGGRFFLSFRRDVSPCKRDRYPLSWRKKHGRRRVIVTDDILYRRYLGGDEDSLSALMERHGDKLTLYLDGCLHDLHESEDLMIEVFAYLIAKQPRIRDGGFRAYLYRSARRPTASAPRCGNTTGRAAGLGSC